MLISSFKLLLALFAITTVTSAQWIPLDPETVPVPTIGGFVGSLAGSFPSIPPSRAARQATGPLGEVLSGDDLSSFFENDVPVLLSETESIVQQLTRGK